MVSQIFIKTGESLPFKATPGSAGYDLHAAESVSIPTMSRRLIGTGIFLDMPSNFEAQIRSRSGLAWKNGIIVLNAPGTIDSDYRDEVKVILYNTGSDEFVVEKGMRIAQMVFSQVADVELVRVDSLSTTKREGGFGSTGLGAN